jgi:hypothetical protein
MNGKMFVQQETELGLHISRHWRGLFAVAALVGLAIGIAKYSGGGDAAFRPMIEELR